MSDFTPTRESIADALADMNYQLRHGCGNHGCVIVPPRGQGTNMSCRCRPRHIVKRLLNLSMFVEEMGDEWFSEARSQTTSQLSP